MKKMIRCFVASALLLLGAGCSSAPQEKAVTGHAADTASTLWCVINGGSAASTCISGAEQCAERHPLGCIYGATTCAVDLASTAIGCGAANPGDPINVDWIVQNLGGRCNQVQDDTCANNGVYVFLCDENVLIGYDANAGYAAFGNANAYDGVSYCD